MPDQSAPAKQRMVESAVVLLAKHGFQATSFSTVLEASGAPRGSIYHHFPDGKDQLIAAAVDLAGDRAISLLDSLEGARAAEIVDAFLAMWRVVLERSDFSAGCSVLAVTVSADTAELVERAGRIFRAWADRLASLFETTGMTSADARGLATLLIAASEGAVVLARAERSMTPFDDVARTLAQHPALSARR